MKYLYIFFFFLLSNTAFSQATHTLTGTVSDAKNETILFGEVVLLTQDSVAVKYAIIEDGNFAFDPLPADNYVLKLTCLGYESVEQNINLDKDKNLEFTLEESTNQLDEVTVTAERNAITNENGNLRVTIANSVFSTQPNAIEVLAMLPRVLVSADRESLSIIGEGSPLIYLGNQRISVQELNAIPVEEIKDIQIINNPSAKYEASGRAVVLITRIPNLANGYKVNLSNNAALRRGFNNHAGISSSFKRDKLELKANFNYNRLYQWEGSATEFDVLNEDFASDFSALYEAPRPQFLFGAGVYYQLNKNDYISVNANARLQSDGNPISTKSSVKTADMTDEISTINNIFGERSFFSSNLNYFKKLTTSSSLFLGLQFTDYVRANTSDISNNVNNTEFISSQMRDQSFHINSTTARLNFEKDFTENLKWELGTNVSNAKADAFAEFIFTETPADNNETNYDYSEINYAAYTQLSGKWNKVTYTAGVRAENNVVTGGFREIDTLLVDRQRLVLFPRATLTVPLDSTKTLTFNYQKTINRPHYLNATTITTFINPYYEYSRNINLISSISRSFSVNFQWKQQSFRVRMRQVENPFQNSLRYVEEDNRIVAQPDNFEREIEYSFFYSNPIRYKFLTSTNTFAVLWRKVEDPRAALINSVTPYYYFYSNNQFKIGDKTSLGCSLWAVTRQRQGAFSIEPMTAIGLSASTKLFDKLQVTLNCNDIFRGSIWENRTQVNDITNRVIFYGDSRSFALSLRYSFGKIQKSTYKNKDVDDNLRRIN